MQHRSWQLYAATAVAARRCVQEIKRQQ